MEKMTREQYIQETLNRANIAESESYRAKYWELAGKALGYLEPEQVQNQNIAIFQTISSDMINFLKDRKLIKEDFPTGNIEFSTEKISFNSEVVKDSSTEK